MGLQVTDRRMKWILALGIITHFMAVYFGEGYHRPDEHLGVIRWTYFKLERVPESLLSWEYPAQIRNWLQPLLYQSGIRLLNFLGVESPFIETFFLRLFSAIIAFFSSWKIYQKWRTDFKDKNTHLWILGILFITWFFPFFHARTSSENLSSSLFLLGLSAQWFQFKEIELSKARNMLVGILYGLAFLFRFQVAFMVAPIMLWPLFFIKKRSISAFGLQLTGVILILLLGIIIDFWGYGVWTFSPWHYFYQNIINDVASGFGVSPWYYYLTKTFSKGIPPVSLFILGTAFYFWIKNPKHPLTWATLPFFLIHSLVGHKELRFVFCLGPFFAYGFAFLICNQKELFSKKIPNLFVKTSIIINVIALLYASSIPAYSPISFYRHLYRMKEQPKTLYNMRAFREQLQVYLREPLKEITIEDREEMKKVIEGEPLVTIRSNKYEDLMWIKSFNQCRIEWRQYPIFISDQLAKYSRRSKQWFLAKCEN